MYHSVDEAVNALKQGEIIIVVDDEDRENEGDFVALAEHATPEVINFMALHGRGFHLYASRCVDRQTPESASNG